LQQLTSDIRRKFFDLESLQTQRLNSTDENGRWHVDESSQARARNRYSNIIPWESNRIRLNVPKECCDYINASLITLKSQKDDSVKRYIATQGPREGQFNHMWRMIWQETSDIAVVVMLTKTSELGRDKCFQYYPEDNSIPWHIRDNGEFNDGFQATITLLDKRRDTKSASTVRKLLLQVGDKKKIVWHLLFKGWPDYNVPEGDDKAALIELIKLANEKNAGRSNPLIVHCSAGVGRSGTFITLDHFIREIDGGAISVREQKDLVFETVDRLREQRMFMVQSPVQFQFIYDVLQERFRRRSKSSSPPSTYTSGSTDPDEAHHSA